MSRNRSFAAAIVIATKADGETYYFGPFPSEERAHEYGSALTEEYKWSVNPLIVPNAIAVQFEAKF